MKGVTTFQIVATIVIFTIRELKFEYIFIELKLSQILMFSLYSCV